MAFGKRRKGGEKGVAAKGGGEGRFMGFLVGKESGGAKGPCLGELDLGSL